MQICVLPLIGQICLITVFGVSRVNFTLAQMSSCTNEQQCGLCCNIGCMCKSNCPAITGPGASRGKLPFDRISPLLPTIVFRPHTAPFGKCGVQEELPIIWGFACCSKFDWVAWVLLRLAGKDLSSSEWSAVSRAYPNGVGAMVRPPLTIVMRDFPPACLLSFREYFYRRFFVLHRSIHRDMPQKLPKHQQRSPARRPYAGK